VRVKEFFWRHLILSSTAVATVVVLCIVWAVFLSGRRFPRGTS
jgi:hypothetical protein